MWKNSLPNDPKDVRRDLLSRRRAIDANRIPRRDVSSKLLPETKTRVLAPLKPNRN